MKKFLVAFVYTILSLLVSMNILQLYYNQEIWREEDYFNAFIHSFINAMQMTVVVLYIGVPIILLGCVLGELLFRYIILPNKLHFSISLLLYILLGTGIVFVFGIVLGANTTNIFTIEMMPYMGLTAICSITFFVSRTMYERK